jgi:hypothetical protein
MDSLSKNCIYVLKVCIFKALRSGCNHAVSLLLQKTQAKKTVKDEKKVV